MDSPYSTQALSAEADGDFDPIADLYTEQPARPPHLGPLDLRTLTPFQRALLAIDGTVTSFIEAYALEPVEVRLLRQEPRRLPGDDPWLAAPGGAAVIAREVLLQGRGTGRLYVYAASLLLPERLTAEIRRGLEVEPGGLGRILLGSRIENRRELLWYGRERLSMPPATLRHYRDRDFISRSYRIVAGGSPAMLINERYPLDGGP